jgi:UDP-glucuronate 4-epimerase
LQSGHRVVGVDNLNAYYDPRLKAARLDILRNDPRFSVRKA